MRINKKTVGNYCLTLNLIPQNRYKQSVYIPNPIKYCVSLIRGRINDSCFPLFFFSGRPLPPSTLSFSHILFNIVYKDGTSEVSVRFLRVTGSQ